jgi:hypothetical protein
VLKLKQLCSLSATTTVYVQPRQTLVIPYPTPLAVAGFTPNRIAAEVTAVLSGGSGFSTTIPSCLARHSSASVAREHLQMQPAPPTGYALPSPILGYLPTTFLERGVVMPYTTPQLVGARLRPGERGGLELIVPNISGAKGVYILGLDAIHALCSPTLHDRAINAALASLRAVTPSAIRHTARAVAARGLAGREAAAQAVAAMAAEQRDGLLAHLELLLELLRQVEPRVPGWVPPEQADRNELGRRARHALGGLTGQLGRSSDALMSMLQELAALFSGVGIGRQAATAQLPQLIAMLDDLRQQMRRVQHAGGSAGNADASVVEATADLTLNAARKTLGEAAALLTDVPRLLGAWASAPDKLARQVTRPDWLLDGWERICLLWRAADDRIGPAATLIELVTLVPTVPREAAEWVGSVLVLGSELTRHRRKVLLGEDWRTGITHGDLVARNERLRAWSPSGPG